jgi:hypothetical protein
MAAIFGFSEFSENVLGIGMKLEFTYFVLHLLVPESSGDSLQKHEWSLVLLDLILKKRPKAKGQVP